MEQKRNKWFLLQPEQRDTVTVKDRIVVTAMFAFFIISVLIYKQTGNETTALLVMSLVAAIGAADSFYELRQPHVKRAARRYLSIGIGCAVLFFVMLFVTTKQIAGF